MPALYPYQQAAIDQLIRKKDLHLSQAIAGTLRMNESVENRLSDFDSLALLDLPAKALIDRARITIASTMKECGNPRPGASEFEIKARLTDAMRLTWIAETVENFSYDFGMIRSENVGTMRLLEDDWRRNNRGTSRTPGSMQTFYRRFADEFGKLRDYELKLRGDLEDNHDEMEMLQAFDGLRFNYMIDACFDCALNMEANFEARVFADDDHSCASRPRSPSGPPPVPNTILPMERDAVDWSKLRIAISK